MADWPVEIDARVVRISGRARRAASLIRPLPGRQLPTPRIANHPTNEQLNPIFGTEVIKDIIIVHMHQTIS